MRFLIHAWRRDTSGENWKVLLSLLPARWQQAALESGAVKRLRGFSSPETLLRTLLLHVGLGYSLRETVVRPETLEVAKYVVVFTTRNSVSAAEILEWYRTRWQIELVFERLKSLVQLGHLPKHDDRSSRAWLHGKLLVALLTQKLLRIGRDISSCECIPSDSTTTEPVA